MTLLSSAASPAPVNQLRLARDDDPQVQGDVTASERLHWVPLRHSGLRERSSQILQWAEEHRCAVLVSDVSVEVLLLARLLSIPPVAVALRGQRLDRAHALGYDVAAAIVAPWPRATHGEWPERWLAKTVWVGAVSRFDGRTPMADACAESGRCVVLMLGRGGDSMTEAALRAAGAVRDTHWHLMGGRGPLGWTGAVQHLGWVADPWPVLCRADVVVAAAGDSAIADVAAAGRPLIALPQDRPYGEQHDHAAVLVRHGFCASSPTWPDRYAWPGLLDEAQTLGGARWSEYCDGLGSAKLAQALLDLAGNTDATVADPVPTLATAG